jgi:hypothetical protein
LLKIHGGIFTKLTIGRRFAGIALAQLVFFFLLLG